MEVKPGYKQTEIGIIPVEWETYVLEEISERISVGLATSVTKHYRRSGVPIVRNLNIKDGYFDGSDMLFVSHEFASANSNKAARAFDVLTVHTGSNLGQTCVLPLEFDNCQTFTTLITTPKKNIADSCFLCLHMSSDFGRNEMARLQAGGGKGNLNTGELKKYRIALPPRVNEQRAIAEAIGDVDGLLGGLDRLMVKKRDLKQAAMQQLLTGQTRLPGFHGEWQVKTLGDIVEKIVGGGTPSRANGAFWGNEIPWVTVKDFATFKPRQSQESITRLGLRNSASHLIPAGTLLTSTRMALGKAVVYEVDVAINQDLKALFLKPETSVEFFNYWFEHFGRLIDELGSGSTVKGISLGELRRFPFRAPSHTEQTAIAEVLTEMDAELAALAQRREKTRALKQAIMQELLTGNVRLVSAATNVAPLHKKRKAVKAKLAHNWQINEAVVISVLTKHFGSEQFPLGRKRYTKFSYLLHRHIEKQAQGYLKKAAGPYNPATKYKGPEDIALKNNYVRRHTRDKFSGFVSSDKIAEAENYFAQWYGKEVLTWLEQFRRKTNDDLELLTTVDMAMEDLSSQSRMVDLKAVKGVIGANPEWEAKLSRPIFSDANIKRTIGLCKKLFGS